MIGTTISHYHILEKLGEGGMGIVYKAQDTKLDRMVALKILPSHLSAQEEGKARFMQEAKATAALNHPNILNLFEIDETKDGMFFAMEYLDGKTLRAHIDGIRNGTGIPYLQVLEWTTQIANGLSAAHQKGIVHRDIKPENIMITRSGQVKIMDFGIAKLKSGSGLTRTRTSVGTASYMSPEQIQGVSIDHRSDIWSLGVLVYEMLTSDLPFKAEHEAALLYLIVNDDPPLTSSMDKKIPRNIDPLVMRMLAKEPRNRYETMVAVADAIEDVKREIESSSTATRTKGITVLPFGNLSSDKDSDYFCDGLTEELIVNLSKLKDIRVIPRSKVMLYKGTAKEVKVIGRELGTRYVLSGNVRKFQDNLRISVELIDTETDEQLWAETYKGKLEDVFDIQEKVSKQIVEMILVKISPTEKVVLTKRPTLNTEAYDCYLRARNFLYNRSKNGIQFAIQLFQKAIDLDMRYAHAYAGLSESYAFFYQLYDRRDEWLDKAIESSLKALMYDPTLSEAYSAMALSHFHKDALDEASVAGQKAIDLDPTNYLACWILGRIYHTTDREHEALELFNKVVALNPDFYSVYSDLQIVYVRLGQKDKADEILRMALVMYERYLSQYPDDARCHMFFAVDLAQVGQKDRARAEAARAIELNPTDPLMMYNAACFYAQMGDPPKSVEMLRNAIAAGYSDYEWFRRDPDLDTIRLDPGYIELMKGK
ncbi:MAG: protein kinase [Bacteroidetes bacterium]|nr:protein kinase [Bacteroidota bacterium]